MARTGLPDATMLHRLVRTGVVQPTHPWGRGQGRPSLYGEIDVTAVAVRRAVAADHEGAVADRVARCSRTGCAYVVHVRGMALGFPTLGEALAWLEMYPPGGVLVDVACVLAAAVEPLDAVVLDA